MRYLEKWNTTVNVCSTNKSTLTEKTQNPSTTDRGGGSFAQILADFSLEKMKVSPPRFRVCNSCPGPRV